MIMELRERRNPFVGNAKPWRDEKERRLVKNETARRLQVRLNLFPPTQPVISSHPIGCVRSGGLRTLLDDPICVVGSKSNAGGRSPCQQIKRMMEPSPTRGFRKDDRQERKKKAAAAKPDVTPEDVSRQ